MREVDDDGNSIESPNDEPAQDEQADDDDQADDEPTEDEEPSSRKYTTQFILNWQIEEILLNYLWNFR